MQEVLPQAGWRMGAHTIESLLKAWQARDPLTVPGSCCTPLKPCHPPAPFCRGAAASNDPLQLH